MNSTENKAENASESFGLTDEILEYLNKADRFLQNPLIRSVAKKNINLIVDFLDSNPEHKVMILELMEERYPDLFDAVMSYYDTENEKQDLKQDLTEDIITESLKLRKAGKSFRDIADELSDVYEMDIYPSQVWRLLKKIKPKTQENLDPKKESMEIEYNPEFIQEFEKIKNEMQHLSKLYQYIRYAKAFLLYGSVFVTGFIVNWLWEWFRLTLV